MEEGDALLKNLFKEGDTAELEKNLEAEYEIEIEWVDAPKSPVEETDEAAWDKAATTLLADAYGEEEPDYSDVPLLDPNPNYKP